MLIQLITSLMLPAFSSPASEADYTLKVRQEQKAYYQNFENEHTESELDLNLDLTWENTCKYISNIFEPPLQKVAHLTFDDGPSSSLTPQLLDILKEQNVKVTFFVLGQNVATNKIILARAIKEGHLIASHSWNHPDFHTLSEGEQISQITTADSVINPYMSSFKLFRYPYGNSTCFANQKIHGLGYGGIVGWHIDSCDWAYAANNGYVTDKQAQICEVEPQNKADFVGHVMREFDKKGGGIILMHDVHENTVNSVREIILRLKKNGFSFMNLDDPRVNSFFK